MCRRTLAPAAGHILGSEGRSGPRHCAAVYPVLRHHTAAPDVLPPPCINSPGQSHMALNCSCSPMQFRNNTNCVDQYFQALLHYSTAQFECPTLFSQQQKSKLVCWRNTLNMMQLRVLFIMRVNSDIEVRSTISNSDRCKYQSINNLLPPMPRCTRQISPCRLDKRQRTHWPHGHNGRLSLLFLT